MLYFVLFRCQAILSGTSQTIPIKQAHFVRDSDQQSFPALIHNNTRAILEFENATLFSAGRYRCEIITESNDLVWGWLFVNSKFFFF